MDNPVNQSANVPPSQPTSQSENCSRLAQLQLNDEDIGPIVRALMESSTRPDWESMLPCSQVTKVYWTKWHDLEVHDGVMYVKETSSSEAQNLRLVAPKAIQADIIREAHAGFTGGHFGRRRTTQQVRRRAYWVGWSADVRRSVQSCAECARYKRGLAPRQGPLQSLLTGEPWERIGVDITGPHPRSRNGYVYILTLVDYFSKWADAFPLRNQEATTVAKVLIDRVFAYFGTPLQILTDRGRNFESELFAELCRRFDIDHVTTTAYKPSTNGLVERFHRTLNSVLAKVVNENQRDWDDHLPYAVAAYRATPHESTGYTPNLLFLSRENRAPIDLIYGTPLQDSQSFNSPNDFVALRQEQIRTLYADVRAQLGKAAERQKKRYDLRVHKKVFTPGEWVWYFHPRRRIGRSPKWQKWYTGPFLVIKQVGPVDYQLQRSKRSAPFISHVDKLKTCLAGHPPSWSSMAAEPEHSDQPDTTGEPPVQADAPAGDNIDGPPVAVDVCDRGGDTPADTDLCPQPLARPRRSIRLPIRFRSVRVEHSIDRSLVYCYTGMDEGDKACQKCGRRFRQIKALRSHLRAEHCHTKQGAPASAAVNASQPSTVQFESCSPETRKALDRVVVTLQKWNVSHPALLWEPSPVVVQQLRRVPGADRLPFESLLAAILTKRACSPRMPPVVRIYAETTSTSEV